MTEGFSENKKNISVKTLTSVFTKGVLVSNTINPIFNRRGFTSGKPTQCWEEALPSGNGKMGAMMMGEPANEIIIFSHKKLFLPIYGRWRCPNVSDSLPELRRLLQEQRYKEAWGFEVKIAVDRGINIDRDFRGRDPFYKAFDLKLTMPVKTNLTIICAGSTLNPEKQAYAGVTSKATSVVVCLFPVLIMWLYFPFVLRTGENYFCFWLRKRPLI